MKHSFRKEKNKFKDEIELINKFKKDPEFFSELYDIYFPKIFKYVMWKVGNQFEAEDIVSNIFTKTLSHLDNFRPQKGANFSSWLFRIAHNTVIDHYRKNNIKTMDIENLPEIESNELLPNNKLDRKLLFKKLYSLVQKLPQRQKEIITLRFFGEMKNKEIAQVLKIKEKSVSSILFRGLETLYKKLKQ